MSKKKNRSSGTPSKQATAPEKPAASRKNMIGIVAIATVVVVVLVIILSGRSGGGAPVASAEEAAYIGRLLPAGYESPVVAEATDYTSEVEMVELSASAGDTQITVPVAEVTDAKLTLFRYQRPDGSQLPLISYVRPSGELFVGISFCPPCQGEWQAIEADGTLTCNACGTKRDLETQVGISGSCQLYPLDEIPATVVGADIVIDRAVLDAWTSQPLDRDVG